MTTVAKLSGGIQSIRDQIIILTRNITNNFNGLSLPKNNQNQVALLNQEADTYNRQFEEAEYKFISRGRKTRKQTLQEFVILFFFVSYALLTVTLVLYAKAVGGSIPNVLIYMSVGFLASVGFIVRYG